MASLGDVFLDHARSNHEWSYGDQDIRNYAEATQRLTGPPKRVEEIGRVEIRQLTEERLEDWLEFFDHRAFVGNPGWASCYCIDPFTGNASGPDPEEPHWTETRQKMVELIHDGTVFGYIAYVDGTMAGWVNASKRSTYRKYSDVDLGGPNPKKVVGISCFVIAPPFRRHGLAKKLLDHVIAEAEGRGADWVEGYPFNDEGDHDGDIFRGPRPIYDRRGFEPVEIRERDTVVRRHA